MTVTDVDLARKTTRYEVAKRALILFTAVLVTACFVVLISLARSNHQAVSAIQDCTQPTGKCYQRSQKQTAGAVADINRVVILAAACASGLPLGLPIEDRQARIQACVIDRLARVSATH
jgi:uncharacterized membrane protein SpoIIM required for sporulation